jgi:hypothetical protein
VTGLIFGLELGRVWLDLGQLYPLRPGDPGRLEYRGLPPIGIAARFSAMIRMRACCALSAEAAIAWVTPAVGLTSAI